MKILLINPPYSRLKGAGQASYFPLGLGCLASAVPSDIGTVRILNLENPDSKEKQFPIDKETIYRFRSQSYALYQQALNQKDHPVWLELRHVLNDYRPDLVGLTVMTVDVGAASRITTIVKSWNSNVSVLWGGVHPTFEADSCLSENGVDYVIRGEGELSFREFCREHLHENPNFSNVPGLSYRYKSKIIHNDPPPLINNLDDFFPPRRDCDFFPERYTTVAWGSIMASRGCPWQCTFCSSPYFWQRRLRYRDSSKVFEEIKNLIEQGKTRHFTFWDDSFTANSKKVEELCRYIIDNRLNLTWKTATRIDLIDDDLLELMFRAGCIQLQIGIETGSKRMAGLLKKDVDPFKSIEVVRQIKKHNIGSGAFFMAGFYNETIEDLNETFRLMKELDTDEIVLNVFDPMPGSDCFKEMKKNGLLKDTIDWNNFPLWPDRHFAQQIPENEFNQQLEKMSSWIFSFNNNFRKKWQKNKAELQFLIKYDQMTLVKKLLLFGKSLFSRLLTGLIQRRRFIHRLAVLAKWLFWRIGSIIFARLPIPFLHWLGNILGSLTYKLDTKRREMIIEEMSKVLEKDTEKVDLEKEARTSFTNFFKDLMITFHYPTYNEQKIDRFIKIEGYHHLESALERGKGAILLTAHFGAHLFPLLALKPHGHDIYQLGTPPAAWEQMIGKKLSSFEKNAFIIRKDLEETLPGTFIFLNSSMRKIYSILKENAILIIAFDGRAGTKWKEVPLLGRQCRLSRGPFHLSYRSEAPIIPTFTIREPDDVNTVVFYDPIWLDKKKKRDDETDKAVTTFISVFSSLLKKHPGHYGWLLQAARIRADHDDYPLFVDQANGQRSGEK